MKIKSMVSKLNLTIVDLHSMSIHSFKVVDNYFRGG